VVRIRATARAACLRRGAYPALLAGLAAPAAALAHGVTEAAQQRLLNGSLVDVAWIGAEHMLTGYDHLLFLFGILLFLTNVRQVVLFVTAFTLGHTITLLFATLHGITANPFLVDAVIALTVIYKAFENMDGFRRWLNTPSPNLLFMVFAFGLVHGFGLSTRLQQMTIADDPRLVEKILAFNVGVELGQVAALLAMGAVLKLWRGGAEFPRLARAANVALIVAGAGLFALQVGHFFAGTPAV
jgi:HupE / UreJ protein